MLSVLQTITRFPHRARRASNLLHVNRLFLTRPQTNITRIDGAPVSLLPNLESPRVSKPAKYNVQEIERALLLLFENEQTNALWGFKSLACRQLLKLSYWQWTPLIISNSSLKGSLKLKLDHSLWIETHSNTTSNADYHVCLKPGQDISTYRYAGGTLFERNVRLSTDYKGATQKRFMAYIAPRRALKSLIDARDTERLLIQFSGIPVEQRSKDDWSAVLLYLCSAKRAVDVLHLLNLYFQHALLLPPLILESTGQNGSQNNLMSPSVTYPIKTLQFPPKLASERRRRRQLPPIVLKEIIVLLGSPSAVSKISLAFASASASNLLTASSGSKRDSLKYPACLRNAALSLAASPKIDSNTNEQAISSYFVSTTPELRERERSQDVENSECDLDQTNALAFVLYLFNYIRTHAYAFSQSLDVKQYNRVLSSAAIASSALNIAKDASDSFASTMSQVELFICNNGAVFLVLKWIYEDGFVPESGSWTILLKAQRDIAKKASHSSLEKREFMLGEKSINFLRGVEATEDKAAVHPTFDTHPKLLNDYDDHAVSKLSSTSRTTGVNVLHSVITDTFSLLDQAIANNVATEPVFALAVSTVTHMRSFSSLPEIMDKFWNCGLHTQIHSTFGSSLIRAYLAQAQEERIAYTDTDKPHTRKHQALSLPQEISALTQAVQLTFSLLESGEKISKSLQAAVFEAYSELVGGDPLLVEKCAKILFPNVVPSLEDSFEGSDDNHQVMLKIILENLSLHSTSLAQQRKAASEDKGGCIGNGWFFPFVPELPIIAHPTGLQELTEGDEYLTDSDIMAHARAISIVMRSYATILSAFSSAPSKEADTNQSSSLPIHLSSPQNMRDCIQSICVRWKDFSHMQGNFSDLTEISSVVQILMKRLQHVYTQLRARNLPLTKSVVIALLKAFASGPSPQGVNSALGLLTSLKTQGFDSDRHIGNVLLTQVASQKDSEELVKVIESLRELGYPFDDIAFNSVLSHFAARGNRKAVYAWFAEMDSTFGDNTIPNVPSSSSLVSQAQSVEQSISSIGLGKIQPTGMSLLYLLRTIAKADSPITSQDLSVTLYAAERLYAMNHDLLRISHPALLSSSKSVFISIDEMLTARYFGDALLLAEYISLRSSPCFMGSHLQLVQSFLKSSDDPNEPTFVSFSYALQALTNLDRLLTAIIEPECRAAAIKAGIISQKDCFQVDSLQSSPGPNASMAPNSDVQDLRRRVRKLLWLMRNCRLIETEDKGYIAFSKVVTDEGKFSKLNGMANADSEEYEKSYIRLSNQKYDAAPLVRRSTTVPSHLHKEWLKKIGDHPGHVHHMKASKNNSALSPPRLYLPLRLERQLESIAADTNYLLPLNTLDVQKLRHIQEIDLALGFSPSDDQKNFDVAV